MATLADVVVRDANLEGVASALGAARDGIDALLRDRGLRRTAPELTTASLLKGALASATLEGSAATEDDVRTGADPVVTGAARLNAQLLGLLPVIRRAPLQAVARMHALATTDPRVGSAGRPRPIPGLAERLHALAALLVEQPGAPALAIAAIAHAEVAVLAPFEDANGIVARALERLLLVSGGVDPSSLTVPEAGHAQRAAEYRAGLAAYATTTLEGHRQWLLHAARAVTAGAAASPLAG